MGHRGVCRVSLSPDFRVLATRSQLGGLQRPDQASRALRLAVGHAGRQGRPAKRGVCPAIAPPPSPLPGQLGESRLSLRKNESLIGKGATSLTSAICLAKPQGDQGGDVRKQD